MPTTIKLHKDIESNGLALCCSMRESGIWFKQPEEVRHEYCVTCPFRFLYELSCETEMPEKSGGYGADIEKAIQWSFDAQPVAFSAVSQELYMAYYKMRMATPFPAKVLDEFLRKYPNRPRERGHINLKGTIKMIEKSWANGFVFRGPALYRMFAAFAVIEVASKSTGLDELFEVSKKIVNSCRAAIDAKCSLEVS